MGEPTKDPNQTGNEETDDKTAFAQLDKSQQTPADFDQVKSQEGGQPAGQQQDVAKAQRQQGDEDLDEDSKSSVDGQGMR